MAGAAEAEQARAWSTATRAGSPTFTRGAREKLLHISSHALQLRLRILKNGMENGPNKGMQ